jgi:hypothetical protein
MCVIVLLGSEGMCQIDVIFALKEYDFRALKLATSWAKFTEEKGQR